MCGVNYRIMSVNDWSWQQYKVGEKTVSSHGIVRHDPY